MKFTFTFLAVFCLSLFVNAQIIGQQDQSAIFEDGTTIKYSMLSNRGDDQFVNSIVVCSQSDRKDETGVSLMYERFDPDHYFATGQLGFGLGGGFTGIAVGGTYFLGASDKNYKLKFSVRTVASGYNEQTNYVLKSDAIKNRHFGLNAELGYDKFTEGLGEFNIQNRFYTINKLSAGEIALGVGYVATKQALLHVDGKTYMGGCHLFHLTVDLLFQPGLKFDYTAADSASATVALNNKEITNGGIGFRFMLQGQTSLKFKKEKIPNRNAGFFYRLGLEKAPYISPSALKPFETAAPSVCLIAGFGAFWSFGS